MKLKHQIIGIAVTSEEAPPEPAGINSPVTIIEDNHKEGADGGVDDNSVGMNPSNDYFITKKSHDDEDKGYHHEEVQEVTPSMSKNEELMVSEESKQDLVCRKSDVSVSSNNNQKNDNVSAGMVIKFKTSWG